MNGVCFLCGRPVLGFPGQDVILDSALFSDPFPDGWKDDWFGACHVSCLTTSSAGRGWAEFCVRREQLHSAHRELDRGDRTRLFANRNGGLVTAISEDGERTVVELSELRALVRGTPVVRTEEALLARRGRSPHFEELVGLLSGASTLTGWDVATALRVSERSLSPEILQASEFRVPHDFSEWAAAGGCWAELKCELFVPSTHRELLLRSAEELEALLS